MGNKLTEATFDESAALGAPDAIARSPWVVLKFGGTSVSTRENWDTIAGLVQARLDAGLKPVVVHSALSGISNALEKTLDDAVKGDPAEGLAADAGEGGGTVDRGLDRVSGGLELQPDQVAGRSIVIDDEDLLHGSLAREAAPLFVTEKGSRQGAGHSEMMPPS